ncbi:MAG: hypothetical protein K1X36_12955 [Pyrinomonadaceae bacterium]|nr:hypothetical protein [Pyrinomonadaceae bacterium]
MTKRRLLFILAALFILVAGEAALACSCLLDPNKPAVDYSAWAKDFKGVAFSGRVKKIEKVANKPEIKVIFGVDKIWRGIDSAEAVIYTAENTAMCGVYYEVGREQVVIADSSGDRITTFSCSEMEYTSHRSEYLAALGVARKPSAPSAQTAQKFVEFGNINCETELAYLDSLAIELQNEPQVSAYIIIYGGSRGKRNDARARLARMKHYLTVSRGITAARLKQIDGGYRQSLAGEIWIVRPGDTVPRPSPTVGAKKVRLKGTAKVRGYNCGDEMGLK